MDGSKTQPLSPSTYIPSRRSKPIAQPAGSSSNRRQGGRHRGSCTRGSRGSAAQGPCAHGRRCRSASHGTDRTSHRSRRLHRWGHNRGGCRRLSGKNQSDNSKRTYLGYIPSMISHSGFWTRSSSGCGSRRPCHSISLASLISSWVRWRMKTGFPRHLMITCSCQSARTRSQNRRHETHVLALGNSAQADLDLGLGQDVGGRGHVDQEV